MKTKTEKAVALLEGGDFKAALSIISTFRIGFTKNEKRTLEIAKECLSGNEAFYISLGIDTAEMMRSAKEIVNKKYNN